MACTALSRVLGFVRVAVIGAVFGATGVADVLNAVFMIPNNLRKLLAEGALSSALIPELARALQSRRDGADDREARILIRRVLTLLTVTVLVVVTLAVLFARPVVEVMLEFPEAWKMELAAELFRLVFPYLLLVSVGAVLMAVLNCHDVFVVPALAPLLFSVNVIAAIVLFHRHWGLLAAGIGILAGGIGGVVGQLPLFLRRGYDLRPDWRWSDPRVRRIVRQWVPVVASASIFAITQQVALVFASGLEDGSTSALANALVFWQLPFGILSVSVVTAHFPRMSRHAAAGDGEALRETFAKALRLIVALMLPPAVFYLFFGEQVIQVALERMTFTAVGTRLASRVLTGYTVGLLSVAAFNFAQRYFYAIAGLSDAVFGLSRGGGNRHPAGHPTQGNRPAGCRFGGCQLNRVYGRCRHPVGGGAQPVAAVGRSAAGQLRGPGGDRQRRLGGTAGGPRNGHRYLVAVRQHLAERRTDMFDRSARGGRYPGALPGAAAGVVAALI